MSTMRPPLTFGQTLGLLLALGLWVIVQPTQPRHATRGRGPTKGAASRPAGQAASARMQAHGTQPTSFAPISERPAPDTRPLPMQGSSAAVAPATRFDALDMVRTPGTPSPQRSPRRAAQRARQLALRAARRAAHRARLAARSNAGIGALAAAAAQQAGDAHSTRASQAARAAATPGADGAGKQTANPGTPTETPEVGTETETILPIKATDMDPADAHTKLHHNGEALMFANSTLTSTLDLQTPAHSLSVFAHADMAGGEWPELVVLVNGTPVGSIVVDSAVEKKFYLPIQVDPGNAVIQVTYVNDFYDAASGEDRNVYLSKLKIHAGL